MNLGLPLVALAALAAGGAAAADSRHRLECPPQAPAEWGGARGSLVGVDVLSARRGEAIDESAPPSLVPDAQQSRAGTLHQTWRMNADGPEWVFHVWCRYAGSTRVLKLAASGVRQCERVLSAAHPDRPPQQMFCD
ncbi:MAG TPA: STY0301 family protein [Acetobacteraceae bacterium]|jgi:hypothetical protein|nr:STY0301 family protein [Acetobacteraceae bacterium]